MVTPGPYKSGSRNMSDVVCESKREEDAPVIPQGEERRLSEGQC